MKNKQQLKLFASLLCLPLVLSACKINLELPEVETKASWLIMSEKNSSSEAHEQENHDNSLKQSTNDKSTVNETIVSTDLPEKTESSLSPSKVSDDEVKSTTADKQKFENAESSKESAKLADINNALENQERQEHYLQNLPQRNILQMKRVLSVEQELRNIINEERDKVGLSAYLDNNQLTLNLETQVVYNLHYLLDEHLATGPENALLLSLNSDKELSDEALSTYFAKQTVENEANRIFLIGDGYDQLSLLLMYCQRTGDEQLYHYIFAAMPWKSTWATEINLQKRKAEVNGNSALDEEQSNNLANEQSPEQQPPKEGE